MFINVRLAAGILLCSSSLAHAEALPPALGQNATHLSQTEEWNLTIMPDGKNLPTGSGTASQGQQIFSIKCAGCHGINAIGGSAEPLVGEVGSLTSDYPEKTVNSYWPYATSLFDYIRRAMPPSAPYSLSSNEIYALCAYILNEDDIIDGNVELNATTLPQVTMPNRDGFSAINLPLR